jgi:hypothetical protein
VLFESGLGRYYASDVSTLAFPGDELVTALICRHWPDIDPAQDRLSLPQVVERSDREMTARGLPPMGDFTMDLYPPGAAVRMYGPGFDGSSASLMVIAERAIVWAYTTRLLDGRWVRTTTSLPGGSPLATVSLLNLPSATADDLHHAHQRHVLDVCEGMPASPAPANMSAMLQLIDEYLTMEVAAGA